MPCTPSEVRPPSAKGQQVRSRYSPASTSYELTHKLFAQHGEGSYCAQLQHAKPPPSGPFQGCGEHSEYDLVRDSLEDHVCLIGV